MLQLDFDYPLSSFNYHSVPSHRMVSEFEIAWRRFRKALLSDDKQDAFDEAYGYVP
jgi:hypothetical protein